ncbi:protein of unknown function DUF4142 [Gemmatirosa kalamazoonensis]|uniref:DUF4142 domain-containing protein n=1 Tax=Gemmatirosa kalamazoonensis TaxID=861299 RepID=W0REK1_9BACT|nr:DUF4142 domain-containing protein [Gemmatirosa kalamazoonensis]AHG89539.1 protein of unknown function DUF4142 [Gemmatirosa kalamazoonensis]
MRARWTAFGAALCLLAQACGGDASRARSDSAAARVAASPAATPLADTPRAAPSEAALDSARRKARHIHGPLARPAGELSEESVEGMVDAINASDAQLAGAALGKATNPDVKRFASVLASAHRQKVSDSPPLNAGSTGPLAAPLRALQASAAARLDALPAGAPYDRAFVEAQIAAHERALALLDSIRPVARSGDLPALVASTRSQVVRHLDEARALQRRLP